MRQNPFKLGIKLLGLIVFTLLLFFAIREFRLYLKVHQIQYAYGQLKSRMTVNEVNNLMLYAPDIVRVKGVDTTLIFRYDMTPIVPSTAHLKFVNSQLDTFFLQD